MATILTTVKGINRWGLECGQDLGGRDFGCSGACSWTSRTWALCQPQCGGKTGKAWMQVGLGWELLMMQEVLQVDEQGLGTMLTTVRDLKGGRDFG